LATKRVFPHMLRPTCALTVLQATEDLRKVSLWLGHAHMQTTEIYTRVDPSVKLEALESVPPQLHSGRFKASGQVNRMARGSHFYVDQKAVKMIYWPGLLEAGSA
jgi:hypothetical protein